MLKFVCNFNQLITSHKFLLQFYSIYQIMYQKEAIAISLDTSLYNNVNNRKDKNSSKLIKLYVFHLFIFESCKYFFLKSFTQI